MSLMERLYPEVESLDLLPTCWSKKDKFTFIGLSRQELRVHYKGIGKTHKDAASVRANQSIPAACGIFYFEVKIISKGRDGYMGLGLSQATVSLNRLPGWDKHSYGYHGDDGHSFCSSGTGKPYGPTFTTGDIIGCGVNLIDKTCFYTKNGINLGVAFTDLPPNLYPTVGLQTPGEIVEANFGHTSFKFDIESEILSARTKLYRQVESYSDESGVYKDDHSFVNEMVMSYLVHHGFTSTAEAFSKTSGISVTDDVFSIRKRQHLQKLILAGKISEATEFVDNHWSQILHCDELLLLMVKIRQFIEMIGGYDQQQQRVGDGIGLSVTQPVTAALGSPKSVIHTVGSVKSSSTQQPQAAAASLQLQLQPSTLSYLSQQVSHTHEQGQNGTAADPSQGTSHEQPRLLEANGKGEEVDCDGERVCSENGVVCEEDDRMEDATSSPPPPPSAPSHVHDIDMMETDDSTTSAPSASAPLANGSGDVSKPTMSGDQREQEDKLRKPSVPPSVPPGQDCDSLPVANGGGGPDISTNGLLMEDSDDDGGGSGTTNGGLTTESGKQITSLSYNNALKNWERLLEVGRELQEWYDTVSGGDPDHPYENVLKSAFSLLAYSDPYTSPLSHLLSTDQREYVWSALNSAILVSQNKPAQPLLDQLLIQIRDLATQMSDSGVGDCAFLNASKYFK